MTIEQTVEIPADRRIILEVPPQIPAGTTACFEVIWFPQKKTANDFKDALNDIRELCKDSSLTVDSFLEMRRRDNELEERQYRRLFAGESD